MNGLSFVFGWTVRSPFLSKLCWCASMTSQSANSLCCLSVLSDLVSCLICRLSNAKRWLHRTVAAHQLALCARHALARSTQRWRYQDSHVLHAKRADPAGPAACCVLLAP